jgi:hypothetical protein
MSDERSDPREVQGSDDINPTEWTADVTFTIKGFDQVFLAEAMRSGHRAKQALQRKNAPEVAGATAAAVLVAAAACEARLSEYVTSHEGELGATIVSQLRSEQDALEQWRVLLRQRDSTFRPGDSREYQALCCLFQLRNLVAHRNARYRPLDEWPDELDDCVRQKAIPVHRGKGIDWTSAVYVEQVAEWAAKTAFEWLALAARLGVA